MKQTEIIMGTPIIVEIVDSEAKENFFEEVFNYFKYVDQKFSTYKNDSEIMKINRKEILEKDMSTDMKEIFKLAKETKNLTDGYFDIVTPGGEIDPSGIVKGWSIFNAGKILKDRGVKNFYVEAGGDTETFGKNEQGKSWCVGIQNPFNKKREIIKKVYLDNKGIATSGNYVRGDHIYNPKNKTEKIEDVTSITVIGPNIFEADRYATAAFAMGKNGIYFIEELPGFESYSIDKNVIATMTTGFDEYTKEKIYA
jgi:thiamine biosynthesis lipoprotein